MRFFSVSITNSAENLLIHLVVVASLPIVSKFDNENDFEGWTCGKITTCGKYGNICGGYDTKARKDYIQRTFLLPAGKYYVTMDFIKIDSWLVWWTGRRVYV